MYVTMHVNTTTINYFILKLTRPAYTITKLRIDDKLYKIYLLTIIFLNVSHLRCKIDG